MDRKYLRRLLERVKNGELETAEALDLLAKLPFENLGFAKIDHHRTLRRGIPEVVFGQGKTPEQIEGIVSAMAQYGSTVVITRTDKTVYERLAARFDKIEFHPVSGVILVNPPKKPALKGTIAVFSAGTTDIPVAEEAALTARAMGCTVETVYDVGVAGLHRLLSYKELLHSASVIIVVAGMDGALPSAVAGFVSAPVVAVPTSSGYGASFGGLSALLSMLNSCASGVTVVNIDNGFGAGYFAALVARNRSK